MLLAQGGGQGHKSLAFEGGGHCFLWAVQGDQGKARHQDRWGRVGGVPLGPFTVACWKSSYGNH